MGSPTKRYFAFLIALPALLLLLVFRVPAVLQAIILPFKQYSIAKGMSGSPWIGFANFGQLFSNAPFWQVLANTLIMNAGFFIITILLAFIIGLSLSQVKNTRLYGIFCIFFVLPFFIPQMYWNLMLFKLFGAQGLVNGLAEQPRLYLAEGGTVRLLYIAVETIRWTGLFAAAIAFAARKTPWYERTRAAYKAGVSIALLASAFVLISDFELLHALYNPMVYEKVDTMTMYSFRSGLLMMDFGLAAVQWFIQFLLCSGVLLLLLLLAEKFIRKALYPDQARELSGQPVANSGAAAVPAVYSLVLVVVLALLLYSAADIGKFVPLSAFIQSGVIYAVLAVIASLVGIFLTVLLAYPLTTSAPRVRKWYMALFVVLAAAGHFGMHDYIQVKSFGVINTYFAIIAAGIFNPAYVLLLGTYGYQKSGGSPAGFGQYLKASLPAIACVFVGSLLLNMDAYTSSLVYMAKPGTQSPTLQVFMGITRPR